MLALKPTDLKDFTQKLFLGNEFHSFLLSEASFTTFVTCAIDGTLQKDFYDTDGRPARLHATWAEVQPVCYAIIRGRRTPLRFRIVLMLSPENVARFLRQTGVALSPDAVYGLFLNIAFDGKQLLCTTGSSSSGFSLDRGLGQAWDSMILRFLKQQKITVESL